MVLNADELLKPWLTDAYSGVTSLGMEHTQILGDTLTLIAREKAGIFKVAIFSQYSNDICFIPFHT